MQGIPKVGYCLELAQGSSGTSLMSTNREDRSGRTGSQEVEGVDDGDEEDPIDEEQLSEFKEMIVELGDFPVSINIPYDS